jgi:hypothetical protein
MAEKSSLTALARRQLELARQASSGRSAHTVFGGHEHVLRQTLIALTAGHGLDEHEKPGRCHRARTTRTGTPQRRRRRLGRIPRGSAHRARCPAHARCTRGLRRTAHGRHGQLTGRVGIAAMSSNAERHQCRRAYDCAEPFRAEFAPTNWSGTTRADTSSGGCTSTSPTLIRPHRIRWTAGSDRT